LAALQVWQALTQGVTRRPATHEVTLVLTDLVGFSDWSLTAGDDATFKLLRGSRRPSNRRCSARVVKSSSAWTTA